MSAHRYIAALSVATPGLLAVALSSMSLLIAEPPRQAAQGGVQILPPPPDPQALKPDPSPEVPRELSDLRREPQAGLYNAEPFSMIIRVPEAKTTAPMPMTVPSLKKFPHRAIEPEILLVPRQQPPKFK